ncbi:NADH:ubiquinone reductase (Na(+)-transporting) subunit C [Lewinellaceae bacterium SD302]|nr:NADH:ubiquinone reductase (Na(+)-transporting) subunit C [Lewinellaceae bacterium SD302]
MDNKKIYGFVLIMTLVVAGVLAVLKEATAGLVAQNEEVFNKRAILAAVSEPIQQSGEIMVADLSDQEVQEFFASNVKQMVLDAEGGIVEGAMAIDVDMPKEKKKEAASRQFPLYEVNLDGERYYVFSVIGNGLWDIIWANIALESDMNTIAGVAFDHAGETPGLGAEIKDNKGWYQQFYKKKIFRDGELVGVNVRKGGAKDDWDVDGLSGATITGDGVTDMIYNGLNAYESFINEKRSELGGTSMLIQQ